MNEFTLIGLAMLLIAFGGAVLIRLHDMSRHSQADHENARRRLVAMRYFSDTDEVRVFSDRRTGLISSIHRKSDGEAVIFDDVTYLAGHVHIRGSGEARRVRT